LFRRFRAAGELPYGAFGEIFWDAQCQEMQQLASRVIACRKPSTAPSRTLPLSSLKLSKVRVSLPLSMVTPLLKVITESSGGVSS
ncbi:hypothetical protein MJI12_27565, partial [Salmonella enterica subsp. enterica serovar Kentucky]|nr:hypothetical protein [Salmonella enterica subsp. enterica serovar Kentucky]